MGRGWRSRWWAAATGRRACGCRGAPPSGRPSWAPTCACRSPTRGGWRRPWRCCGDDPPASDGGGRGRAVAMTLPRWMEPLLDAEQMRRTDEWAIETRGVPSLELMERAGEGLARVVGQHGPAGRIAVVCGKGNNGGDGLVAARL